jgi:hypothetical protein
MLSRRLSTVVLALLLVASCGSESEPPAKAAPTPHSTTTRPPHGVQVLDPVFVMNDDGSATLSARILNHTDDGVAVSDAYFEDEVPPELTFRFFRSPTLAIPAKGEVKIGQEVPAKVRLAPHPRVGQVVPFTLSFGSADEPGMPTQSVALKAKVVARSATYATVAGNERNTAITIEDARIVVVPGQKKAYVICTVVSTIDDVAYEVPTAKNAAGKPVAYRHQTATGGPYGIDARKGRRQELGMSPPYREQSGWDADYVNAKDVRVGETIMVTIPFPSGDVTAPFKVVAG